MNTKRVATPNDLKLSDGGAWRGSCEGGAKKEATDVGKRWLGVKAPGQEIAATVTRGAVRCSAWLGVAVLRKVLTEVISEFRVVLDSRVELLQDTLQSFFERRRAVGLVKGTVTVKCNMLTCVEVNIGCPLCELLASGVNLDSGENHAKIAAVKWLKKGAAKLGECCGVEILRVRNVCYGHPS